MDEEKWIEISEFPMYAVSNHGRVMNTKTDLIKVPSPNQQGIPSILMMKDGRQYRRALPLLVAKYFVPNRRPAFDTPINLDGDRFNNYWLNLDWRPQWFAMAYHHQFRVEVPFGFSAGVSCTETKRCFNTVVEAAQTYGLLIRDIIHSTQTQGPVFPTWQTFAVLPNAK